MGEDWRRPGHDAIGLSFTELVHQRVELLAREGRLDGLNKRVVRHVTRARREFLLGTDSPLTPHRTALGGVEALAVVRLTPLEAAITEPAAIEAAARVVELAGELALASCRPAAEALAEVTRDLDLDSKERKRIEDRAALEARLEADRLLKNGVDVLGAAAVADRIREHVRPLLVAAALEKRAAAQHDDDPSADERSGAATAGAATEVASPAIHTGPGLVDDRLHARWEAVAALAHRRRRGLGFPSREHEEELLGLCVEEAVRRLDGQDPADLDRTATLRLLRRVVRWRVQDWDQARRPRRPTGHPHPSSRPGPVSGGPPEEMALRPPDADATVAQACAMLRACDGWEPERAADLIARTTRRGRDEGGRARRGEWERYVRAQWDTDRGDRPRPPAAGAASADEAVRRVEGLIRGALSAVADGRPLPVDERTPDDD